MKALRKCEELRTPCCCGSFARSWAVAWAVFGSVGARIRIRKCMNSRAVSAVMVEEGVRVVFERSVMGTGLDATKFEMALCSLVSAVSVSNALVE